MFQTVADGSTISESLIKQLVELLTTSDEWIVHIFACNGKLLNIMFASLST